MLLLGATDLIPVLSGGFVLYADAVGVLQTLLLNASFSVLWHELHAFSANSVSFQVLFLFCSVEKSMELTCLSHYLLHRRSPCVKCRSHLRCVTTSELFSRVLRQNINDTHHICRAKQTSLQLLSLHHDVLTSSKVVFHPSNDDALPRIPRMIRIEIAVRLIPLYCGVAPRRVFHVKRRCRRWTRPHQPSLWWRSSWHRRRSIPYRFSNCFHWRPLGH